MNRSAIKLPRRRFFSIRGSAIEFAIGLVALSIIESQQADAAVVGTEGTLSDNQNALAADRFHDALGHLADVDPSALKTLTIEELKALLTTDALASLGLDKGFQKLLDVDPHAALRKLEAAFRKKLAAVAQGHSKIAAASDHVAADHDHLRSGDDLHHDSAFLGGIPLLWPILGLAAVGGIAIAATSGHSDSATPANDAPIAAADAVTTNEDTAITFDVRTNDSDKNGDALAVTQINGTAITTTSPVAITGGSISLGADGRLTFTPTLNYNGAPSFTYTVSDGHGGAATATVSLTVNPVNDAPVAVNDTFTVAEDTPITINVKANDSDVDGDSLTVTQVNGKDVSTTVAVAVTGGSVILNAAGNLVFTPTLNYNGSPTFTYTISDGHGGTATATVSGTVTSVNDAPVAVNDTFTVAEDNSIIINVKANDSDVDGDTLTVTQVNGATVSTAVAVAVTGGSVILNAAGDLVFTPTLNYNGAPTFTYTISDGNGGTATGTVIGTVTPVNDAPVNGLTTLTFTVSAGVAAVIPGLSVSDVDSASLTTKITVTHGLLTLGAVQNGATVSGTGTMSLTLTGTPAQISASLAALTFTGTPGFAGTDTLTIATSDGQLTDTDTLTLNIGAVLTGAVQDGYISGATVFFDANGNGKYDVGELTAVTDASGHYTLTTSVTPVGNIIAFGGINIDTGLANKSILVAPAGSSVVNPLTTLVAQLMSTGVSQAAATAQIATALGFSSTLDLNHFDFLSAGTDPALALQAQKAAVQIVTLINAGISAGLTSQQVFAAIQHSISSSSTGTIDLTSSASLNAIFMDAGLSAAAAATASSASASINQSIADATSMSQLVTTVHDLNQAGANLPPVTADDSATTTEDHAIKIDVLANDKDPEGGALKIIKINGANIAVDVPLAIVGGTVTLGADGQLTYSPTANYNGAPTFTYTVQDNAGNTQDAVVHLTVTPVSDAPVAVADVASAGLGAAVMINVLANDSDVDGAALSVTTVNGAAISIGHPVDVSTGTVALSSTGQLIFTPTPGFVGHATFAYGIADGQGGTATSTVDVNVAPTSAVYGFGAGDFGAVFANATALHAAGVTTFDISGNGELAISQAQADALIVAGINFAIDDHITVAAAGTHLSTTLKGLQDLHVDTVMIAGGALSVVAGEGLGDLATASLPHFVGVGGVDPSVTLDLQSGNFGTTDLAAIAANLSSAGIDHLDVVGGGAISLGLTQAQELAAAHIDFTPAANVTLNVTGTQVASLDPSLLTQLHVDHLDVVGDVASITDAQAAALVATGVDFAVSDNVTVASAGTHLSTTLKGLQDLHVDTVMIAGGALSVVAGEGLGDLASAALPHFVGIGGVDPSVTLDLQSGSLGSTDLAAIAANLSSAGVDHLDVVGGGAVTLGLTQAQELAAAHVDFTAASNVTLNVTSGQAAALDASLLTQLHVDHLDVTTNAVTISDVEASALVASGVDFVTSDNVTVAASGTHLSTTLKGLQDLHVDTVMIAGGALSVVAGEGLGDLATAALPHFVGTGGVDPSVTLDLQSGAIAPSLDMAAIASNLASAGIDHLDVVGGGPVSLTLAQGQALAAAHIDFTPASDVTLNVNSVQASQMASNAALASELHVDHLHVTDGAMTISDAQATNLIAAGLDFAASDTVTVTAAGTHLSTTLKGLQDLHVDTVMIAGGAAMLTIEAGTTDLGSLAAHDLPHFATGADVTVDIAAGTLASGFDFGSVGAAFEQAGVDHIGVTGNGALALTVAQAESFAMSGLDFAPAASITVNASAAEVVALANNPFTLSGLNIDAIHAASPVTISDVQATNLVEAGLHFAAADTVTVAAAGTHLSTTLKGLQDLHIDSIAVQAGVTSLHIDAGDLHGVTAADLPSLLLAQSDAAVDVTLRVDSSEASDVVRLANALDAAGIDHIAFNQPLASFSASDQAALMSAATTNHLTITYETFTTADALGTTSAAAIAADTAMDHALLYRDLLTSFETNADMHGHGGAMQLVDGAASSLAEAGMLRAYTAETLVVDGTTSGDKLLTTLKDIADIGVDQVKLADQHSAPVYVDLGVANSATAVSDIQKLFQTLDLEGHGTGSIFSGNDKVALVVDATTANALSHVDGALSHLASLGFTEVDVLSTPGVGAPAFGTTPGIEVKVIGQDDPLYTHLHHTGG